MKAGLESTQPGRRTAIGLTALVVVAVATIAVWTFRSSPSMTPDQVQRIISSRDLVGLPVREAARRLGHSVQSVNEGDVAILDFAHVPGWSGGRVMLIVEDGRVTSANWAPGLYDEKDPG